MPSKTNHRSSKMTLASRLWCLTSSRNNREWSQTKSKSWFDMTRKGIMPEGLLAICSRCLSLTVTRLMEKLPQVKLPHLRPIRLILLTTEKLHRLNPLAWDSNIIPKPKSQSVTKFESSAPIQAKKLWIQTCQLLTLYKLRQNIWTLLKNLEIESTKYDNKIRICKKSQGNRKSLSKIKNKIEKKAREEERARKSLGNPSPTGLIIKLVKTRSQMANFRHRVTLVLIKTTHNFLFMIQKSRLTVSTSRDPEVDRKASKDPSQTGAKGELAQSLSLEAREDKAPISQL